MRTLTALLRGLGADGAAANARAELERAHAHRLEAELVVRRVTRSSRPSPAGSGHRWREPARVA